MNRVLVSFFGLFSVVVLFAACAGEAASEAAENDTAGVGEKVESACDCFKEGLTDGQKQYCRESKRYTSFLEELRQCGQEMGSVSAVSNLPLNGKYSFSSAKSVIQWKGSKLGLNEKGTVPLRSAKLEVDNDFIVGASVVIEMSGIEASSQEGRAARELGQHLRGPDFFDVANHPTASFSMTSARADGQGNVKMKGDLTVKGQTKPVQALVSFASTQPVVASVSLIFNRADFDVRYGSGRFFDDLGDDLISDEVELRLALVEDTEFEK